VDGHEYVERHIDGGTTSSMFFARPGSARRAREAPAGCAGAGSDIYVLVAERCTRTRPR